MTKALPFTVDSICRIIKAIEKSGRFVVGCRPDGTLIIGDKPVDTASLVPAIEQPLQAPTRRFGEKINGGQGEG